MILNILHAVVYEPLYNALIFLVDHMPGHDVGLAVIALTIIVRLILYPLSRRAVESQLAMKKVGPEVEALKKKYKDDAAEQNKVIFALYKERGVHPFAGAGLMLVQLLVLIPLYYVFVRGGLPHVDSQLLYSFVPSPSSLNMDFLGIINMSASHNIALAALVALSQYLYTRLSMGKKQDDSAVEATLSSDMAKSFDFQARYVMPIMFGCIAYFLPAVAPLYLLTANIFMICQELWSGRRF